ncbi:LPXTG-motif cell wall anchor domain-containing protein [Streptococcus pyogenes]|uniref:LPXTG cell wall anchor domain-containing protein n=2 Tax=Streptococcus pyogenes TaxID=1314 RepID=UPI0010D106CF|nr:DUF1542 domain-containing protein [Streptococcus pyogenes]VGZ02156.1 LPXTG-motif cell wall anchor domain-containing protein [Streptococcus pyogenes]VGZ26392.1 LPXTG-motif cell wall anchor domain-containing protein [Streptococcus pyogenes]VHH12204.1 LPXTG-motif cell wall anchor domain-containing protein [Streptococcus pyogenes]VHH12238.1 LPXTG-motif cell wall anchor domain-containing protein [Streptococcus pyogenes]VHH26833.1 LPXTG-motif cell wall anchor domain-containing protein [Streptococ
MFLKHHDVKQKNWRMRKVKKVFVSSCMLLTVGLGVAVPTAFSQSNGVMVVKAEGSNTVKSEGKPKNLLSLDATIKYNGTANPMGRYYAKEENPKEYTPMAIENTQDLEKNKNTFRFRYDSPGSNKPANYFNDISVQVSEDRNVAVKYHKKSGSNEKTSPKTAVKNSSVALKVDVSNVKKGHQYEQAFKQTTTGETNSVQIKYLLGFDVHKTKENGKYKISDETEVAKSISLVDSDSNDEAVESRDQFTNKKDGNKKIKFTSLVDGKVGLTFVTKITKDMTKEDTTVKWGDFEFIDITKPATIDTKSSNNSAFGGENKLTVQLQAHDGRTNFEGEKVEVYRKDKIIGVGEATKDGRVEIKLTSNDDKLLNEEELRFQVVQPDSNKRETAGGSLKVQVKPEVKAEQINALEKLKKSYEETKKAITTDKWLTEKAKQAQLEELQKEFKYGQEAIKAATETAKISEALTNYTKSNDGENKGKIPATYKPIGEQQKKELRDDAAAEINAKKKTQILKINQEKGLPKSKRDELIQQVEVATKEALEGISNADGLDSLNEIVKSNKIENIYEKGDLDNVKKKALEKLDQAREAEQKAIAEDPTLTTEQQKDALYVLEGKYQDTHKKLVNATDADVVKNVEDTDIPALKHIEGTPLAEQQKTAEEALKAKQKEIETAIAADNGLTATERTEQFKKSKDQLEDALQKVKEATKADDLNKAKTDGEKAIAGTYEKGDLAKVKDKAKEGLTATYNETVKNIKADSGLTADEQKTQLEGAEKAYKAGEQAITTAENADKVGEVLPVEKKKISDEYKAGDLLKVKQAQKDALQKVHDETVVEVEKDKGLTTEQKDAQKAKAAEALKKGQDAVEAAQKADEAIKAGTDNQQPIKDSYTPGKLDDVQTKATADLKKAHTETVDKIDADNSLDAAAKAKQKGEADKALAAGKDAITKADDADKVSTAVTEHTPKIKAAHKTGDLKKAQVDANTALDKAAEKEREEINNDITLTAKDKEQQLKEVETALTKAKDNVKAAKTADAINDARDKGVATIDAVHKAGQDLGARKSGQVAKLEEAAKATKDKISADPTLTTEEKAKQVKDVDAAKERGMAKLTEAKNADELDKAYGEGVTDIKNQHKSGDPIEARRGLHNKSIDEVAQATKDAITADTTLTEAEKETQRGNVDKEATKAKEELAKAKDADALDKAYGDGVTSIKNQHKSGDPIEARRGLHNKSIDEVAQATKDAITADTTLTEAEKETQRGNVDKEATKAKEGLAKAKDADALDKAYGDGVTSIKNQHKSGKGLDVRKDEHKKALEAVAKRVTAEIEADPTLTPEVREQQKAEVQKELELATDKIAEAKDADEADKAYGDGVTAIENAHVIGKGIEARKDLAKKDLAEAAAKTKALIIEDKTLTDDQRKEQLLGVDTEYAKGIENIDAAKDAAGVDKAYSDGVRDILAQYKEGQNLNDRRNAAKEFLLKEADKVTKLINDDPTLTHDQKVDQINKVEQAKLDAIKSVDDAQTADAINDALGKGIENINNQYQHGDGVDVRKATAKGDLEKEAAKVKALIAKDPTLTQADKDKQTAAVDAAKNTAIAAVDKATTADGVNQELGKGITAINKAYRPGEGVKARKEAAKADLEKEAAKVKALIAKDPTLTQADKDKQTAAVDAAKNTAIAAVDKATTAEGINQELGKGITAINKAYRPGEGVKARKEAAKADLEREAAKVREAIANDPTLTKADKAKQTEAVAKALKAAIAAVDKATTAEGINQELGKGITAINKAYRPGEGVKARKEAAKANLEKVAKETKALISGDRYLSETEKAVQKQAVEQALAKALGQVEAAKTVEAVKLAENLGTVAIRSAYVAGLAKDTDQATAALNEAKQAAIEALKQAAAETLAKITTDAKLTEAQKAEQSENVSLALKTAIATVRSAQSIASVKEAIDKGITAIRAAYVPNKAVAKSSSANHLPKSGDANSIVLVGLGVMSLLLGMVLYSKKKESKD